jgi:hypothetical protein
VGQALAPRLGRKETEVASRPLPVPARVRDALPLPYAADARKHRTRYARRSVPCLGARGRAAVSFIGAAVRVLHVPAPDGAVLGGWVPSTVGPLCRSVGPRGLAQLGLCRDSALPLGLTNSVACLSVGLKNLPSLPASGDGRLGVRHLAHLEGYHLTVSPTPSNSYARSRASSPEGSMDFLCHAPGWRPKGRKPASRKA